MLRALEWKTISETGRRLTVIGLSEQELREGLAESSRGPCGRRANGQRFTRSIARIIELDHLRIEEQLERAGVRFDGPKE
jgi:hypothetical protein